MSALLYALELLFPRRQRERLVMRASEEDLFSLISPSLLPTTGTEVATLLPRHHPLVAAHLLEAVHHGNTVALQRLSRVLADYLEARVIEGDEFSTRAYALVPVPPLKGASCAEAVVSRALQMLGKDGQPARLLSRTSSTFASAPADPALTYILIDERAATLRPAAAALTKAGATHVIAVALVH